MNFYDWSLVVFAYVQWTFQHINWMVLFGFFLIAVTCYVFWKMASAPKRQSSFDFSQMFEGDDGKTSMAKFGGFVAMLTGTWAIVALITNGHMTEGYFGLYMGLLIAGKVGTELVASRVKVAEATAVAGGSDPDNSVNVNVTKKDA